MFKVERTAFRRKLFLTFTLLTFGVAFYFTLSSAQADPVWTKVGVPTYAATEDALVLSGSYAAPQVFNASGTELTFGTDFKYGSSGEDVGKLSDLNYLTKMCLSGEMSGSVKNNLLNDGSKVVLTFTPNTADWRSRLPIVKYSVTTANDGDERDPDDWILYGTNDGTEWTQLASVTNAALPGGDVKESDRYIQYDFPVDTYANFSQYRFEFTGNREASTIFQMGDLVLWSENPESTPDFTSKPELNRNYVPLMVTGCEVWKDGASLAENKSSTWYFGTNEGIDQLLDQEIVTASDAKTKMCAVASSGNFFDRFDSMTLDFQNAAQKNTTDGGVLNIPETIQKKELTAYSITTGNDQPNRTPDDWVLYGSDDNKNWTVLDTIEGAGLSKLSTMYTIPLEESVPANRFYRLEITDSIGKIQAMQFSEFTLWDTPTGEEYAKLPAAKNITVTPRGGLHSNDYESVAKLQDGRTDKFLAYLNANKNETNPATQLSADSPLSLTFEMDDSYLLESYSFTTANDRPDRDASDWQLYGSNNGTDWTLLDEVFDFVMTDERYATHQFDLDSEQGYGWFRFDFLGTKGETNGFQLAELTFYGISTNQVPEPASFVLLAFGVLGLFSMRKLRKGTQK